ncbi:MULTISPECIES: MBL fold metallo-hydrolase [unclassified Streptomyces]|uniref:ComEC/Rec2 family competence protein n=1 Tax=unclassified Streptomyces TaxID=2593676 RepID=UPI0033B97D5A
MPRTRTRKREASPPPTVDSDRTEAKKKKREVGTAELEGAGADAEVLVAEAEPMATDEVADGDLRVDCLDVLQGDCTLITTPGGRRIMIDCGFYPRFLTGTTTPSFTGLRRTALADAVRGFLGEGKYLDILILTHPDLDHHNEIARCLPSDMRVGSVYYSGKYGDYQLAVREHLRAIINPRPDDPTRTKLPKQVFCRWTTTGRTTTEVVLKTDDTETVYGAADGTIDVRDTANCLIKILVEPKCTVSILAAGLARNSYLSVQDDNDIKIGDGDTDGSNCGSVVTLVEAHGKKLLFCGDATCSTELFLVDKHATRIADLDLLRVAHHGSGETSSTKSFIEMAKAKTAVISSGRQYSYYHHPRWAAVSRYLNEFKSRMPSTPPVADGALPLEFWHGYATEEGDLAVPPPTPAKQRPLGINRLTPTASGTGRRYDALLGYPLRQTPYTHMVLKPTDGLRDAVAERTDAIEEDAR